NGSPAIGTIVSDSYFADAVAGASGIQALQQVFSRGLLDSGVWHIKGTLVVGWTVAAIAFAGGNAGLQDPAGHTMIFGRAYRIPLTGCVVIPIDQVMSLDTPGWRFIAQVDATVNAADNCFSYLTVLANKLI